MKQSQILVFALIFSTILILGAVDAAKKKRQSKDKRPLDIEPELYCNSCQAIVREVLKKIGQSRKEYDVADALTDLCVQRNFSEYEFPPPDMIKGCNAFISFIQNMYQLTQKGWDEVLETMLIRRANNESIENDICLKKTRACLGADAGAKGQDEEQQVRHKKGQKVQEVHEEAPLINNANQEL